jgi:putative ABC transport system permease protein
MFAYYFELAWRSVRRSPGLTALMVLAIAVGVGACMTTLTVYRVLAGDPIPQKSAQLFYVQLAASPVDQKMPSVEPNLQLTRYDAQALLAEKRGLRQVMMVAGSVTMKGDAPGGFGSAARFSTADFFAMFDVPMRWGSGWTAQEDASAARVVVLSHEANERLFGGADSRGKTVKLNGRDFRVIGVTQRWRLVPHFYDIMIDAYSQSEGVYLPFSTAMDLHMGSVGHYDCWAEHSVSTRRDVGAPCSWLQYWVELASPEEAPSYYQYLKDYAEQQRRAGRFEKPASYSRISTVMQWLQHEEVVPRDVQLQVWLAFGFLLVGLVNTVALLLAKSLRRSGEIGVRRALGAARSAIFWQFLVEAASLGLVGGLLGLGLTWLGLWAVRQGANSYAAVVQLDAPMLAATLGLALLSSLIAGLLPAWRACQVTPALQLKVG